VKNKIMVLCVAAGLLLSVMNVAAESQDTYINESLQFYCSYYGAKAGISDSLLCALIEAESSGRMYDEDGEILRNKDNPSCYGVCQINEDVWGDSYTTEQLQVKKACEILSDALKVYPEMSYALDRYNGNPKAYKNYVNGKTSKYAKKILDRAYEIEDARGYHNI